MKTPLDSSFDTHFIHVDQCYKSTLNIVVRAKINTVLNRALTDNATTALLQKHPYVAAKVIKCGTGMESPQYNLEHCLSKVFSNNIREAPEHEIKTIMEQPSPMREHRFDIYKGELAHVEITHDDENSILELSCAHLIGDVTAVIILFSDLLKLFDQAITGKSIIETTRTRLTFDETRYNWQPISNKIDTLPFPSNTPINEEMWPEVSFDYKRGKISTKVLKEAKTWLQRNNINGGITDIFYYIIEFLYTKEYTTHLDFSAILSFRHLFDTEEDRTNINTSAIFSKLVIPKDLLNSPKDWIEKCSKIRNQSITRENVIGVIHFLRCLNYSMNNKSIAERRALINAYIPTNSLFAINNFGLIDRNLIIPESFKILDIDIQDGIPAPEIRIFGYNGTLHVNPMLDPEGPVSADKLLTDFHSGLIDLIRS